MINKPFNINFDGESISGTFNLTQPSDVDKLIFVLQILKVALNAVREMDAKEAQRDMLFRPDERVRATQEMQKGLTPDISEKPKIHN